MDAKEAIEIIQSAVADVKKIGQDTISVESLENYLGALDVDAEKSRESQRLEHQRSLAHYDAQTKHQLEMFRSVIEAGREALKSVILINGGAAVAILGLTGAAVSKSLPSAFGQSLA